MNIWIFRITRHIFLSAFGLFRGADSANPGQRPPFGESNNTDTLAGLFAEPLCLPCQGYIGPVGLKMVLGNAVRAITSMSVKALTAFSCLIIFLLFILTSCTSYDPSALQPRQLGWQPDRDLTPFLHSDSVIASLDQVNSDKSKLDSLLDWTDMMGYYDEAAALEYANAAYRLSVEKGYRVSQSLAMYYRALLKGRGQIIGEGIEDALADAKISQRLIKETDDPGWFLRANSLLGYLYYRNRRFDKSFVDSARHYASIAFKHLNNSSLEKKEAAYLRGQLYEDLAHTYRSTDSLKFVENMYESIDVVKVSGNQSMQAAAWRGLGIFYVYKRDLAKADEAFRQSEKYAVASDDKKNIISTYQRLGDLRGRQYNRNKDEVFYQESMQYLRQCLSIQKENLFYTYELIAYNFNDKFRMKNGSPPKQYTEEGDSAIIYFKLAMEEAKKEGALGFMEDMVGNINRLCGYKSSLTKKDCYALLDNTNYRDFLNENYADLVDTMRNELQSSNLRIREFEQREQASQNKRRVFRNWLISGIGLIFSALVFLILFQGQQKKKLQARMDALRAQINPHFISNSLNAIENLVNMNKREAASKYLIHFSRLTRKILNSSRDPMTSLKEEMQTLKHFLALEQLRFRDKLTFEMEVAPGIDSEVVEVPSLILQPYVENAILHGIKPKKDPGHLKIYAERRGKNLVCIIEDDGIGRKKAREIKMKSTLHNQKSQGMKINEERLKIVGRAKGAKIEIIDLHNTSGEATGTRVEVRFPFRIKNPINPKRLPFT